ncbi:MAG: IS630 family transposase [Planctomycetes bacterium]|nr:IS630 family transposase [Planctomycetota bacterium]
MMKKYIVRLTDAERLQCRDILSKGRCSAEKRKRANIVRLADADGPALNDEDIAVAASCAVPTVERIRKRLVLEGFELVLERKKRADPPRMRKLDGKAEARLIATMLSEAPEGRERWTLHMMADELVKLELVDSIAIQTIASTPKKNKLRPHKSKYWLIPPKQNAGFVTHMEDVLDVYELEYDPNAPVVCMDEQPVQLVKETRVPIKAKPGSVERIDYEYERVGTASIFMFTEPLGQWRAAHTRKQRTAIDWAEEIAWLLEEQYADAPKVILVCDNLNTHKISSLYKAFEPERARRLARRLEIHYTPVHGSWLNIAECELSVMSRQGKKKRTPDIETLTADISAWATKRNQEQTGVDWQFKTEDARVKLKRLYPVI